MKSCIGIFIGLLLSVSVSAESLLEGRVRLASGAPAAGMQVRLFDLADLRRSISTTTDETGHFTLALQAFAPGSALPQGFALGQNYPNPFNPSTLIPYQIPTAAHVRLEVFNVLGQRVATLVDGERAAGSHTAAWTATDATGRAVGAGVYIYRLSSGGATVSRRMVLIDGQAGIPAAGAAGPMPMPTSASAHSQADAGVYGLTISGEGVVAYVNPAFRVGVDAADIVVAEPSGRPRMKLAAGGILGDVNNDGQVDISDALYVMLYIEDNSTILPNNGDISLGDVNEDGVVNFADALILIRYIADPFDPALPAGMRDTGPDLVVEPPWVSNNALKRGESFTLRATVRNQGTGNAASTTLRFYRSDDETIDTTDTELGTDGVRSLNASGTSAESIDLLAPASDGPYYYGACVEAVSRESQLDNNCSSAVLVVVGADLVMVPGESKKFSKSFSANFSYVSSVESVTYDIESSEVDDGLSGLSNVKVSFNGQNSFGLVRVNEMTFSYNLRVNPTVPSMTTLRARVVYGIYTPSSFFNQGSREATYTVSLVVFVSEGSPDLIVEPSVSDNTLTTGQSFTLRATVRNSGTDRSDATTLRYYRSTDATISASDTQIGMDAIHPLDASDVSAESIPLTAPSTRGTYYYGACVESVRGESDTRNNCSRSVRVTVIQ